MREPVIGASAVLVRRMRFGTNILNENKMANMFVVLVFSLLFFYNIIASEEEGSHKDYDVNVTILGKEDVNTPIYQKYLAHLKKVYNKTKDEEVNLTLGNPNATSNTAVNETSKKLKWFCEGRKMEDGDARRVLLVNESTLLKWINASVNGSDGCAVVMFYTPFCRFSANIAPQFNAFGRAYNNTPVLAIDAYKHSSLNARFGVVAVPTILIFHAGKPVLKFNHSKTLDVLRNFVQNYTGLEGNMSVVVSDEDYEGPVSSIATIGTDYYLILSTLFVLAFGSYVFTHSYYGSLVFGKLMEIDWTRLLRWCKIKNE